jgi:hypothetical protein
MTAEQRVELLKFCEKGVSSVVEWTYEVSDKVV